MNKYITKEECSIIISKLTDWLKINNSCHYLYLCIDNELNNYENQFMIMERKGKNEDLNTVQTEFYKQIQ